MVSSFGIVSTSKRLAVATVIVGAILAGLSIQWISPTLLLLAVGLGIAGVALMIRPVFGIYAVLITQLTLVGRQDYVTLAEMISFGLLVFVLLQSFMALFKSATLWHQESMWLKPLIIFGGLCILNVLPAVMQDVPLQSWLRELFPLLNYALLMAACIWIRDRQQLKQLIIVVGSAVSLVLVRDFMYDLRLAFDFNLFSPVYRVLASLFGAGGSALFSTLALLLSLEMQGRTRNLPARLTLLIIGLIGAAVLILSGTRTYWFGLLIALVIWLIIHYALYTRRIVTWSVGLVLLAAVVFTARDLVFGAVSQLRLARSVSFAQRLDTLSLENLTSDESYQIRYNETQRALREAARSPLLGRGLGYQLTSLYWTGEEITRGYVHNFFAYMLLKLGVVGLAGFTWLLISLVKRLWLACKYCHTWEGQSLASVLLASLACMTFISVSTPHLNAASTTLVLSLLLGAIFGATMGQCQEEPVPRPSEAPNLGKSLRKNSSQGIRTRSGQAYRYL